MTIKLFLLKSGEDIIADASEMSVGEGEQRRVIGYFVNKPCIVKMRYPEQQLITEETGTSEKKSGYEVSLFPWMPLSADNTIPIVSDWVVTMVEPVAKLKEMYITDVVNYGKDGESSENNQTSDSDEQQDTHISD